MGPPLRPAPGTRVRVAPDTLLIMSVAVALLQVSVTDDETVDDRVERVLGLAREVAADHDLIVLPELWSVGAFSTELMTASAEPLDGPLCAGLARVAGATGTWVFAWRRIPS